jgi:hypothetical protein
MADKKNVFGHKIIKDGMTVIICSNITGDNKLNFSNRWSKKRRGIKNFKCLPADFQSQINLENSLVFI